MKKLLGLLALGTIYYLVQAKEFLKEYTVRFVMAKLDFAKTRDSGFSKIYFTMKMVVKNETDFTGAIQSGNLALFYKGKLVGTTKSDQAIEIKGKEELVVKVPVTLETIKLVSSIPDMFQMLTNTRQLKFQIQGQLNFKVGIYKINQEYIVQV